LLQEPQTRNCKISEIGFDKSHLDVFAKRLIHFSKAILKLFALTTDFFNLVQSYHALDISVVQKSILLLQHICKICKYDNVTLKNLDIALEKVVA